MAEKYVQNTKYKYELNASLVIQGNQGGAPRNENEPSGEGTSLARTKLATFGDRAQRSKPTELLEKAQKKLEKKVKQADKEVLKRKKEQDGPSKMINTGGEALRRDVLTIEIQEDLVYRPKSKETKAFYEQMLLIV